MTPQYSCAKIQVAHTNPERPSMTTQLRSNVRNFLLPATIEEILTELHKNLTKQDDSVECEAWNLYEAYSKKSKYILEVLKERLAEEKKERNN